MQDPLNGERPANSKAASPFGNELVFRSEEIFKGKREVIILHGDSRYRLQITKAGKLILIK